MPVTYISATSTSSPSTQDAGLALSLPRTPSAAAIARRGVTSCFGDLLGEETLDDVLLVVSELVTNALLHGQGAIKLRMTFDAHGVVGAVTDEGDAFHGKPLERDLDRVGGHGLHIVGRVAGSWGLSVGSTSIWFEIPAGR